MLVYYDNHEEALTVLTNYAYDDTFPPNPNAYVYLYKFLKEHDPSERNLIKVLKVQHTFPFFSMYGIHWHVHNWNADILHFFK